MVTVFAKNIQADQLEIQFGEQIVGFASSSIALLRYFATLYGAWTTVESLMKVVFLVEVGSFFLPLWIDHGFGVSISTAQSWNQSSWRGDLRTSESVIWQGKVFRMQWDVTVHSNLYENVKKTAPLSYLIVGDLL